MSKKKVGIIGIRGLPARYGAFDTFVDQLVNFSKREDKNFFFYVSCEREFKDYLYSSENLKRFFLFRGDGFFIILNYFFSIIFMLSQGVRKFIFFGYGASIFFPILKLFKCQIICNPDGIEWRRPQGRIKNFFFKLCEKLISSLDIERVYDSKVIYRYYKIKHKANGIVAYYPSIFEGQKILPQKRFTNIERFYLIGRLLEENNTKMIVEAFLNLNGKQKLYLIGSSNNYFKVEVMPLIKNSKNIVYLGPIYNKEKLFKICKSCDFYIHGHSVGGTNPTLIEALSLKKPVISFKTFFNSEVLGKNAIYFKNKDELEKIIKLGKYKKIIAADLGNEFKANYINNLYLDLID